MRIEIGQVKLARGAGAELRKEEIDQS